MATDESPLRVPISTASRKGVSWLAEESKERRLVLTRFGRPAAVVDSADRIDDDLARLRAAAEAVVSSAADAAASRAKMLDLDDVCARLGLDADLVRDRAAALRSR